MRAIGSLGQNNMKFWNAIGMGVAIAGQILVGLGLGYLIDSWAHTTPLWMTVGIIVGTISGLLWLYRLGKK